VIEQFWPIPGWSEEDYNRLKENEMQVDRPGVYSIRNKVNGHVYVGSAISLSRRFSEHLRMLHRNDHDNEHLQRSWNKYGDSNFTFNIERFCQESDLVRYEQEYIDTYRDKIGWDNMYNMNPVADSSLGRKCTPETLAKMSEQQSGDGNGFYGKKHTPESIEKIREAHRGAKPWNKGLQWSDEVKEKISIAQTGKEAWNKGLTKETDERVRDYADKQTGVPKWDIKEPPKGMLGKTHSEESKEKIGLAQRGIPKSEEHNRKNSDAHKGKVFSDEHRRNLSLAQKKNPKPRDNNGRFIASETYEISNGEK